MADLPLPTTEMVDAALIAADDHRWDASSRLCACGDTFEATLAGHALFERHEMRAILAVALEPDLGDGTAAPEENFWDDRTTPLAYGRGDSERDMAARRELAAAVLEMAANDLPHQVIRNMAAKGWLQDRAKKTREGKL